MALDLPDLPVPEHLKYSKDKLPTLLLALGETPVEIRACKKAGIHPVALAFARKADPELNNMIEWAMQVGFSVIEERIYSRAMGETRIPKMFEGKPVSYVDHETGETVYVFEEQHSDQLLKRFAERIRPDLYGDQIQVKVDNRTTVYLPQAELGDKFQELLDRQAESTRLLASQSIEDQLAQLESHSQKQSPIDAEFEEVQSGEDLSGLT